MKSSNIYAADFETSYDGKKTWVWAYGIAKIGSNKMPKLGGSISDFFEYITTSKNKTIYFHNLKFDGYFILDYLMKHDFKQVERAKNDKEFSVLVDNMGAFYSLVFIFSKGNRDYKIKFLDSAKLFPDTLRNLAKSFDLPVQKGDLDYSIIRYENHKMDINEEKYLINDVVILKNCIEIALQRGMTKMTIASNALDYYKNMIKSKGADFSIIFPPIEDDVFKYLQNAYKGGCSMLKNEMANKKVKTYVYDINNMYGNILDKKMLPYGTPFYFKGKYEYDKNYPLYIQHIRCEFSIKKNKPPCIQVKNEQGFISNEWVENSLQIVDLYLTNMDLEMLLENYNVYNLKYIDGYKFAGAVGLFSEYIQHWYKIKVEGSKVDSKIAKLYNNSLYGKFGSKPDKYNAVFEIENNVVKVKEYIKTEAKTLYIPVSIFVTSYGREQILTNARKVWDKFIYCDTDSLHLTEKTDLIPVDNKKLGYFKLEESGIGKYIKQKTYIINLDKEFWKEEDGVIKKQKLCCAGLSRTLLKDDINIDDFKIGLTLPKIIAKKVEGGVALIETEHKITQPLFTEHTKSGGGF